MSLFDELAHEEQYNAVHDAAYTVLPNCYNLEDMESEVRSHLFHELIRIGMNESHAETWYDNTFGVNSTLSSFNYEQEQQDV